MAEEKVVTELLGFGLAKDEAEAYFLLLRAGPSPARIVARRLRVNRMRAYRTLQSLQEKGLVEVTAERPVKFVAVSLTEALDRRIEDARTRVSGLEKSKNEIMELWTKLHSVEVMVEAPKFRILQGREQTNDLLYQMCERAEAEVRFITTSNGLIRLSYAGVDDKLEDLHREGVKMSILTQIGEPVPKALENYLSFADVRHIILPAVMRSVIVDESEVLTTFAMDDSMSMTTQEDTGLWTNASNYVKAMKSYFDALWKDGVPAQEVLQRFTVQQMYAESLEIAKKALEVAGWVIEVPGKVVGESGVDHSFSLVARRPDQPVNPLVLDLLVEGVALPFLLTLNVKSMDVKHSVYLLATYRHLENEELKLAELYGVKPIFAGDAKQLAAEILDEAKNQQKSNT